MFNGNPLGTIGLRDLGLAVGLTETEVDEAVNEAKQRYADKHGRTVTQALDALVRLGRKMGLSDDEIRGKLAEAGQKLTLAYGIDCGDIVLDGYELPAQDESDYPTINAKTSSPDFVKGRFDPDWLKKCYDVQRDPTPTAKKRNGIPIQYAYDDETGEMLLGPFAVLLGNVMGAQSAKFIMDSGALLVTLTSVYEVSEDYVTGFQFGWYQVVSDDNEPSEEFARGAIDAFRARALILNDGVSVVA